MARADVAAPALSQGGGITRRRRGKGWAYFDPAGAPIRDPAIIDRLNAIALPPAYGDCWFNPDPDAKLQATGSDARGRKQYRYHRLFRTEREGAKYDGLAGFGAALPAIRSRVEQDLAARRISRERAIASVVRVLDLGALRVGNEHYSKANRTFGATTLRMRHCRIEGPRMRLRYVAKGGKVQDITITDRSVLRFVRQMQDLPGQHLFQFLDADGAPVPVSSGDINAYLRETTGEDFTAKHFRTWAATSLTFAALATDNPVPTIGDLCAIAAQRLRNTPAIARKSYIHPAVIALLQDEEALGQLRAQPLPRRTRWLSRSERGLLLHLDRAPSAKAMLAA